MINKDQELFISSGLIDAFLSTKTHLESRRTATVEEAALDIEPAIDELINAQLAAMSLEELRELRKNSRINENGEPVVEMSWILEKGKSPELVKSYQEVGKAEAAYDSAINTLKRTQNEYLREYQEVEKEYLAQQVEFEEGIKEIISIQGRK